MRALDPKEILHFAVRIEEEGETYYRAAADLVKSDEEKETFLHLAKEEEEHKKTFQEMEAGIGAIPKALLESEEYRNFISAFLEGAVFPSQSPEERIAGVKDPVDVINLAIQDELNSILFYHELKPLVTPEHHSLLDDIIDEERNHFLELVEMKTKTKG